MQKTLLLFSLSSFLFPLSLGLAQQAQLQLEGKAQVVRADKTTQNYTRSGGAALSLSLGAGDRLCVTEGRGRLVYGVKAFALEAKGAACFEVAKPKSFWDNLMASCQDVGVCKKQAEAAFVKEAKSRDPNAPAPALYLPADYALPTLTLTVAGGQTLRLLDGTREVGKLEAGQGFVVPVEALRKATRLEALNGSGTVVWAAPLRWVNFASEVAAATPKEAALALWTTQDVSYAPAAYSYLLAAGDAELAEIVAARVRAEFRGVAR